MRSNHPAKNANEVGPAGQNIDLSVLKYVSSKKFTFAQSKRFPPKHNPPVIENNS